MYALVRMAGRAYVHVCASPMCMSFAHALLWRRTTCGTVGRALWTLVVDCCLCGVCACVLPLPAAPTRVLYPALPSTLLPSGVLVSEDQA